MDNNIVTKESENNVVEEEVLRSDKIDKSLIYQNTCYNRNNTLIANYVNRIINDFPTPTERYYDIRLVNGEGRRNYFGDVGDQCVMFHSNRICVLTIAPTHPIITENKTIDKVEFTFDADGMEKIDRAQSIPQGKGKKGTQKVYKNSPVCALVCSDESKYIVIGCLTAKLIEINTNICSKPNLVKEYPLSLGYIAILQPNDWKRLEEVRNSLPKLGEVVPITT